MMGYGSTKFCVKLLFAYNLYQNHFVELKTGTLRQLDSAETMVIKVFNGGRYLVGLRYTPWLK